MRGAALVLALAASLCGPVAGFGLAPVLDGAARQKGGRAPALCSSLRAPPRRAGLASGARGLRASGEEDVVSP